MGAYDRDYWKDDPKITQTDSDKIWHRLKSLDEPTQKQIANTEQINAIMHELGKKSKTYEHNKMILQATRIANRKEPIYIKTIRILSKIFVFIAKCIVYFSIGAIIICIIINAIK
ncbi:MAG: hypothetical protein PHV18_14145 [Lachnospiraceae bacterium]|nr:hypothetical protein [Lachnospiraceae bacterium]